MLTAPANGCWLSISCPPQWGTGSPPSSDQYSLQQFTIPALSMHHFALLDELTVWVQDWLYFVQFHCFYCSAPERCR